MRSALAAALLLALLLAPAVRADEPQTDPEITIPAQQPEPEVTVPAQRPPRTLPTRAPARVAAPRSSETLVRMDYEDMQLADVIKAVAKFTGKNFLYDERVRGTVTVISESPVSVDEAYRVFEAILQVKGFTTVQGPGGVLKIIPIREAKEAPIETVTGAGRAPNRDLFITRLVPLKYVKAETIVNTFRPLVSKDANVIAYAPTNTMILTDTAANIRRLMTILAEIDVKTYQDQIKVIPIEFADAGQLAQHLQNIFSEGGQTTTARRRPTRARAQRGGTQAAQQAADAASGATFGAAGQPRFLTDDRTNSIIVIAPLGTIKQVERLVTLLDYKRKGTGRLHVYRLQNADAEEMAQTLSSLAGGPGGGARPAGGAAGGAGAAAAQGAAVANLEGGIRVTADAPTNSLIIQASAEGFSTLRDVIEELDIRRPQVMVEALIMEVSVRNSESFGIGWVYNNYLRGSDKDEVIGGRFGATSPPADFADFATRIIGDTITVIDPTTGLPIDIPIFDVLITAAQNDEDTEIISAPIILTADNEEAQIVVGENIPIPTTRVATPSGGADGNFDVAQNIERRDVGVTLRVTPQISEGDSVRLQIFQEISEVQEATTLSDLGPDTTQRTVENTVFVRDGESVMIGGILADNIDMVESKVPYLGDIPILGWLFKTVSQSERKVNMLIVLTPHIVRDPEDLERLTIEQRERFRDGARDQFNFTDEELEERRRALEAGIDLPVDTHPVRRELAEHTKRYPTESFPQLENRHDDREAERIAEMGEVGRLGGGAYRVRVAFFSSSDPATALLTELIGQGYDGTLLSAQMNGGTIHFVELGPYATEQRAQQVAREVSAESGRTTSVVVEP